MPTTTNEGALNERARSNIRILSAVRRLSAAQIAAAGGFNSRQMIADRLIGRTPLSLRDIELIARALDVDPIALLGESADAVQHAIDNPPAPRSARRRKK